MLPATHDVLVVVCIMLQSGFLMHVGILAELQERCVSLSDL